VEKMQAEVYVQLLLDNKQKHKEAELITDRNEKERILRMN